MTKKKEIDPGLFEYEPQDPDDVEIWESMAMRGVPSSVLKDPKDRANYERYLETSERSK
jgi:hypothetical protein